MRSAATLAAVGGARGLGKVKRAWTLRRFNAVYVRPTVETLTAGLGHSVSLRIDPNMGNLVPRLAKPLSPAEERARAWYGEHVEPVVRWLPDRIQRGLWAAQAKVEPLVPPLMCRRRPVGLNERFRGYRYHPGERFAPHYDGCFRRSDDEESLLTFMLYLNEGMTGGATVFHHFGRQVTPRTGRALFFQHTVLHEGAVIEAGVKYVLRSDVMYRR